MGGFPGLKVGVCIILFSYFIGCLHEINSVFIVFGLYKAVLVVLLVLSRQHGRFDVKSKNSIKIGFFCQHSCQQGALQHTKGQHRSGGNVYAGSNK